MAVDGPGFFAVKTPAGILFTRSGDFKVNAEGQLVTTDGYAVLGTSEAAAATPAPSGREALKAPQRRCSRRAIWLTNRMASVLTKPGAFRLPRARGRIVAVFSLASCHVSHSL